MNSSFCFSAKYWTGHRYFHKTGVYCALASKNKINIRLALFISQMETKRTKWYAMKSHVIAYRSLELLFGTHTFHFNCFFDDFNCVFTQIRCLSRVLIEMPFDAFANRANPDQAAHKSFLIWVYSVCLWNYDISDPTLVNLTSNFFVQWTNMNVYLYNYS